MDRLHGEVPTRHGRVCAWFSLQGVHPKLHMNYPWKMPLIGRSIQEANGRVIHEWAMNVPVSRLWWGLTDPNALPQWLGTLTNGSFTSGGEATIRHAENYFCTSQILECEPEQLLFMTWKFPDEALSKLQIKLAQLDESASLLLIHDGLGEDATSYLPGWHTHLLYLEDLLLGHPRSMSEFWSTYEELREI